MRTAAATALVSALTIGALVGCTAMEPTATPSPVPTPTAVTPPPPSGDGILRIGTLAPLTGANAALGAAHVAAVEIAVRDLGIAGGVLGAPVEVVHRDAADAVSQKAESSFADLVARGVDVIVGPSEPALVERLVPLAAEAGIPLIVPGDLPSAVAAADSGSTLFRVTPSLAAQAAAVGRQLASDGVESLALLVGEGDEGAALADALTAALEGTDIDVVVPDPLTASTDAGELATSLLEPEAGDGQEAAPQAVEAVIVASPAGPAVEAALALIDAGLDADGVWMLGESAVDATGSGVGDLEGAHAVRAGADVDDRFRTILRQSDPGIPSFAFAPEIYDAVMLAAVAAELAADDGGASIAAFLPAAAADGVPCTSFGACLDVIAQDREPDYDGRSGLLTLNADGDVVDARLATFVYTSGGALERDGVLGD